MIRQGRVVAVDWKSHTVDLVMLEDGRPYSSVRVASPTASSNTGFSDLPKPEVADVRAQFKNGGSPKGAGDRQIVAIVAFYSGLPIVIGFLHPITSQLRLTDEERMMSRHASDVYHTIDKDGNIEIRHPSGLYIRIATDPAHEDLAAKSYGEKWKIKRNTDKQVHLHIEQAGGRATLDIAPDGAIAVTTVSTLTATATGAVTVTSSASVTVNAPTCTINAPHITLNGDTVVNGSLSQGMGGSGGACTMLGPVMVTGDVVAGGKSLDSHTHPDAQGGNTGAPN